ncbi:MAG: AMP-binding protein, partial [Rhodobacteraceae bacterium]|nr:AMP-binding protein [Paracoccaceae bacterium]
MQQHFDALEKTAANHVALSPLSFLHRAAAVYGEREAVVYGDRRQSWRETQARCHAVADSLRAMGIGLGDTVSVLSPNIPELFELHYAVPMTGGVLNTINMRLEPETVAYILDHADSQLVVVDTMFAGLVRAAFEIMGREIPVVDIIDANAPPHDGFGQRSYDDLVAGGDGSATFPLPSDEWNALALNYTSGTSGRPKGVVYHHRGAYLMALGTVAGWTVPQTPTYLSVVPMFHCNGWNHPWAMAIVGARIVFTRDPVPERIFAAVKDEGVTHFGAAPIILSMLVESEAAPSEPLDPTVHVMTAGAPPPPAILARTKALGMDVMQVYGLTETYGHISQCLWRDEWDDLTPAEQAELQAMQGVGFPMVEELAVIDRESGAHVPLDGATQGEIAITGNI